MQKPAWVSVVGILAIIFGVFGILGGAQKMAMPTILEMQQEMLGSFSQETAKDGKPSPRIFWQIEHGDKTEKIELSEMFATFEKYFNLPAWYKTWAISIGLVSMLLAGLYLLAAIFLMMLKPFAIKIFYAAIALSIIWAMVQIGLFSQVENIMILAQIPGCVASIIIDIILLVVTIYGDKSAFSLYREEA